MTESSLENKLSKLLETPKLDINIIDQFKDKNFKDIIINLYYLDNGGEYIKNFNLLEFNKFSKIYDLYQINKSLNEMFNEKIAKNLLIDFEDEWNKNIAPIEDLSERFNIRKNFIINSSKQLEEYREEILAPIGKITIGTLSLINRQKKGNLMDNVESYLKNQKEEIGEIEIDENLFLQITDSIWDRVKSNYRVTEEQAKKMQSDLQQHYSVLIGKKIISGKINEYIDFAVKYHTNALLNIDERIGINTSLTIYRRIMQNVLKNFTNNTSLNPTGEDIRSIQNFNSLLSVGETPKIPKTFIIFTSGNIDFVSNKIGEIIYTTIEHLINGYEIISFDKWEYRKIKDIDNALKFVRFNLNMKEMIRRKINFVEFLEIFSKNLEGSIIKPIFNNSYIDVYFNVEKQKREITYINYVSEQWKKLKFLEIKGIIGIENADYIPMEYKDLISDIKELKNGDYIIKYKEFEMKRFGIDLMNIGNDDQNFSFESWIRERLKLIYNIPIIIEKREFYNDNHLIIKGFIENIDLKKLLLEPIYTNILNLTNNIQKVDEDLYIEFNNNNDEELSTLNLYKSIVEQQKSLIPNLKLTIINENKKKIEIKISGYNEKQRLIIMTIFGEKDNFIMPYHKEIKGIIIYKIGDKIDKNPKIYEGQDYFDIYTTFFVSNILNQKKSNLSKKWYILAFSTPENLTESIKQFKKIFLIDNIDEKATICNNIRLIKDIYGLEAASNYLLPMIQWQIGEPNPAYSELIVSSMTYTGNFLAPNRHGMQKAAKIEGTLEGTLYEDTRRKLYIQSARKHKVKAQGFISSLIVNNFKNTNSGEESL